MKSNDTTTRAIILQDISKSYKLYPSPAHRVKETFHPFRKKYHIPFHALRNFSAIIERGETVGIIGRNGCGKSTLLQIVCGIMPPTSGHLQANGRISAILELGAGFNPEFTGRDNVYLNCSILGMDRAEVDRRIDSILEFAGIGDFIDQPVKTYSSGMSVRLAFSIAINVDPDILVVDEALAVGDAAFQRKCFSRIKSLQEQGTSILFVSHDASAVIELCNYAILMDQGEKIYSGDPKEAVSLYHKLLYAPEDAVDSIRQSIINETDNGKNRKIQNDHAASFSAGFQQVHLSDVDNTPGAIGSSENEQENLLSPCNKLQCSVAFFNEHLLPKSTLWYNENGALIRDPHIETVDGRKVNVLVRQEEYDFVYTVDFTRDSFNVRFCMLIKTIRGIELGGYCGAADQQVDMIAEKTFALVRLRFRCCLQPGVFFLNAGIMGITGADDEYLHRGIDVAMFEVIESEHAGATAIVDFGIRAAVRLRRI